MMKKIISCLLTAIIMLSCIFSVSANDVITVEAETYSDYYDSTPQNNMYAPRDEGDGVDILNGVIAFDQNEWLQYSVNMPKSGIYSLSIHAGTRDDSSVVTVSVRGKEEISTNLDSTGNMNTLEDLSVGNIILAEGENIIKFAASVRVFNFDSFKLTYVGEAMTMLDEENVIEAESADELSGSIISEGSGTSVVFADGSEEDYTLGGYSTDVYCVSVNTKGNATLSILLNDEVIITKTVNCEDYKTVDFGNILFYEGENVVTLKVTDGSINVDFININLFDANGESHADDMIIQAESYDRNEGNMTIGASGGQKYVSFNPGRVMEFDITLEKTGLYQIFVYSAIDPSYTGGDEAVLKIYANDQIKSGSSKKTGSWYDWQMFMLCGMFLEEGDTTLKIEGVSGASHINYFVLKYIGEGIKLNGVTAKDLPIATNVTIPRGTDKFTAIFNIEPNASTINTDNIKLTSNGVNIPVSLNVVNETVEINLLKTLDFDAQINLSINGITDAAELSMVDETEYRFLTGNEDFGEGSLTYVNASNNYEAIEITGKLLSGNGFEMEGRQINMFITYPDGSVSSSPVKTVLSGVNGDFEIDYVLPENSADGMYTIRLYAEYSQIPTETEIGYMKKSSEATILNQLSQTQSSDEVDTFFDDYAAIFGINIEEDLAPEFITDQSAFYSHFVGKEYNTKDEFLTDYKKLLILEKINQANSVSVVETIFNDNEALSLLGLPVERIGYLEEQKQQMLMEVYELNEIADLDEFVSACTDIIEANIAKETGATVPVLVIENVTVETGGGITLNLSIENGISEVKEAVFEITSDSDMFNTFRVSPAGTHGLVTEEISKGIKVTITPKWTMGETKDFATVYLNAPNQTGTYNIDISGEILFEKTYQPSGNDAGDLNTIDVLVCPDTKTITVDVKKAETNKESYNPGKSQSSDGGLGSAPSVKPETVIPSPPVDDEKTDEVFTDLNGVEWAKESIYELLEKGIISESDKFYPSRNIKREEFVKMLVLSLEIYDENIVADFNDVSGEEWYASYVGSAQKAGIVQGDSEGSFGIGKEITRQDMAVMIYRALSLTAAENAEKFSDDNEISDYAKDAVYKIRSLGIINGVGENNFAPMMQANRAMAAKMIYGILMMEGTV